MAGWVGPAWLPGVLVVVWLSSLLLVAVVAVVGSSWGPSADRLHFVAPLSTVGPWLLVLAMLFERGASTWSLRAGLIAGVLTLTAPISSGALARVMAPSQPGSAHRRAEGGGRR